MKTEERYQNSHIFPTFLPVRRSIPQSISRKGPNRTAIPTIHRTTQFTANPATNSGGDSDRGTRKPGGETGGTTRLDNAVRIQATRPE